MSVCLSHLPHVLALRLSANFSTSLCLSFFSHNLGIISSLTSGECHEDEMS